MKRLLFSIVLLEAIFTVTSARPTAEAMVLDSLPSDLKIAALFQQTLTHFPPDKSAAVRKLEHKARVQNNCGVVCAIFCPFGNVLDENGCPICRCRPPSTTGVAQVLSNKGVVCGPVCLVYCPFGNVLDANGCPTCRCNQKGNVQFQALAGISVDGLQRNAKAQHNFESLMNILTGKK